MDAKNHKFQKISFKKKLIIGISVISIFFLSLVLINSLKTHKGNVLSVSSDVNIGADVHTCDLNIKLVPERRVSGAGYSTDVILDIYDSVDNKVASVSGVSNFSGEVTFDLCSENIYLDFGNYTFIARGKSHLYKDFGSYNTFDYASVTHDLSSGEINKLLAGETSVIFDNKINSLDISTQIVHFTTNDDKNDLNQDGKVNSLDISNTIDNFYFEGDLI